MPQKAAIIAALTTSRPLCMACVSTRAGLSTAEVEALFSTIQEVLPLRREDGRCRACGTIGPVFRSMFRAQAPPDPVQPYKVTMAVKGDAPPGIAGKTNPCAPFARQEYR